MPTDHEFFSSEKTQCQVHLTSEKVQGNLPQWFRTKESRVKKHFPVEKAFPQDINQFKEKVKLHSGSLTRKMAATLVLEEQRDHLLAEAKSEILKQECKVYLLNTSIREFQRQSHSNRLEIVYASHGYEESRREQARLHEELTQREKALRETHIRSTHEVEKLKRAQEM